MSSTTSRGNQHLPENHRGRGRGGWAKESVPNSTTGLLGGGEESRHFNNKVSEHPVQPVALRLIPGFTLPLHYFYMGVWFLSQEQTDRWLSGVRSTRPLSLRLWRGLSSFRSAYQNELFSCALSQVRFRRYTAA